MLRDGGAVERARGEVGGVLLGTSLSLDRLDCWMIFFFFSQLCMGPVSMVQLGHVTGFFQLRPKKKIPTNCNMDRVGLDRWVVHIFIICYIKNSTFVNALFNKSLIIILYASIIL